MAVWLVPFQIVTISHKGLSMGRRSNSSGESNLYNWVRESRDLLLMRLRGRGNLDATLESFLVGIDTLSKTYAELTGAELSGARILEIGYGARPLQMLAMKSLGFNIVGIDLDKPALKLTFRELLQIYRHNGPKRAIKTAVRGIFFDRAERLALARRLAARKCKLIIDPNIFLVGDASTNLDDRKYDFIYSDNVFEHIPPADLRKLCQKMREMLSDGGIALITPDVFTGLCGGHLTEWYPHTLEIRNFARISEPWEHLRRSRITADCYLNKLRMKDYEEIFSDHFHVVKVENIDLGRGAEFLTDDVRADLAGYSDIDLLCGRVNYWLRSKPL